MSNSSLVSHKRISPNHSGSRTHSIDRITPHCVVGQCSVETLGAIFAPTSRQASCNYGIGADGRVGLYCEEKNRSWCSSSNANDQRAVTIECASDTVHPYALRPVVYDKLIELCADICRRNGKRKLIWIPDKAKALAYVPKSDEMLITVHRWFAAKACPGDWLYNRLGDLAAQVTARLGGSSGGSSGGGDKPAADTLYRVRKAWSDIKSQIGAYKSLANAKACVDAHAGYKAYDAQGRQVYPTEDAFKPYVVQVDVSDLRIRKGPGTNYAAAGYTGKGAFTIVAEVNGTGATKWGKLKSGAGWISLDYAKKC